MKLATFIWKNAERVGAIAEDTSTTGRLLKASGKGDPAMAASVAAFLAADPSLWIGRPKPSSGSRRTVSNARHIRSIRSNSWRPSAAWKTAVSGGQLRRSHPGGRWNVRRQGEDDP